MSNKHKKVCTPLSSTEHLLIYVSVVTGCVSITTFDSSVGIIITIDTPSIRYGFVVKTPRGKFVVISAILKGEPTYKLWHQSKISAWIWLSRTRKCQWVLHTDFSMSFWCRIDLTSVLVVSIVSFPNFFCSGNLF